MNRGLISESAGYVGATKKGEPITQLTKMTAISTELATMKPDVLLDVLPVIGTIRYAERASKGGFTAGEIAWLSTYAALDIVTLAIGFGAAGAGARAAVGAGRGARVVGAMKGAGRFALAEIKAPYTMVRHPVETAKAVYRPFADLVSPRTVPLAAVETSYSTLRIPIKSVAGDTDAVRTIRRAVTDAAIEGKPAKVTVRGTTVRLEPTILKKVGAPVAVHTTPDVRPFMEGAIVKYGREGGLYLAPDVHTRFSYASGFGELPEGGIKGALLIRDERVLKSAVESPKLYKGTAEVEKLLPAGAKIPAPSQILFTRDAAGNKMALLVIGKPFTKTQVANLKWSGALENVYQLFDPAIYISRSEKAGIKALDEMVDLANQRTKLAQDIERYRRAGDAKRLTQAERSMARLINRIDALRPRVQSGLGARSIGRSSILWAQYTSSGALERWNDITGGRAEITDVNGLSVRRLPDVDARKIGVAIPPRTLARITVPEEEGRVSQREPEIPITSDIIPPSRPPTEPPARRTTPRVPLTTITTIRPPVRPSTEALPPRVPPRSPTATLPPRVPSRVPLVTPPTGIPSRVPPEALPPRPPTRPPRVRLEAKIIGKEARLPEGSIAWRQGIFWRWIPREDYTTGAAKPRTLPRGVTPIGAKFTDLRKPVETIQMIGDPGASVPDVAIDLGVADIFISDQAQTIQYAGKGLRTDVGVGVPGTAQGMTVEGGGEGVSRPAMTDYYAPKSVSRPAIAKTKEPVRSIKSVRGINRPKIAEDTQKMLEEELKPVKVTKKARDDFSDLVELTDEDRDDIFGTGERRLKKKPVNRVRVRRAQPIRGQGNPPTTLKELRL